MYRLIVVDDEETIRNGLVKYVDWNSIGFEAAGQFEDGKDAIEYLKKHETDAVLTDVKMYEVSGIELARYVSENCPSTKVVILSGYKEFDYACEAMKYGVCDYVLKPVSIGKIRSVFLRIFAILEKEKVASEPPPFPAHYFKSREYRELVACNGRIAAAVLSRDADQVRLYHDDWFARIGGIPPECAFFIISNLFEELYVRFDKMGIAFDGPLGRDAVLNRLSTVDVGELSDYTEELLQEFCANLSGKKENAEGNMVARARNFIQAHLAENISVEDVAKSVFLSSGYFSREFKSRTGENVIEYIIKCRMDRAMELIRENKHSIREIGATVGYADSKYFQRSFKKYTGYTVREYRKIVL